LVFGKNKQGTIFWPQSWITFQSIQKRNCIAEYGTNLKKRPINFEIESLAVDNSGFVGQDNESRLIEKYKTDE
jgi:hypothetical protein